MKVSQNAAAGACRAPPIGLPGLAFTERPPPLVFARDENERDRIMARLGCERGKENACLAVTQQQTPRSPLVGEHARHFRCATASLLEREWRAVRGTAKPRQENESEPSRR